MAAKEEPLDSVGPLTAFFAGLLTAFTPCVYPAIPLTVAAFGARSGSWRRRAALAALFVLAMAATYGALGALAALGGSMFGEVASHPIAKVGGGLVLVAFGVSLFGVWELRLPGPLQRALGRAGTGGAAWLRAAVLGALSGLLAASCTGPVLGALLVVAGSTADAGRATALLFVYALGLSLPFFALAVLLERLPRSGPFLAVVKALLGAAVTASGLALALGTIPAWSPESVPVVGRVLGAAACGLVALVFAKRAGPWARALTATTLTSAALLLLAPLFAAGAPLAQALFGASTPAIVEDATLERRLVSPPASRPPPVAWRRVTSPAALERALATARRIGRPALVELYADWCKDCRELDARVFARDDVRTATQHFEAIRVDVTRVTPGLRELGRRFGLSGVPGLVWFTSRGDPLPEKTLRGVASVGDVLARLRSIE